MPFRRPEISSLTLAILVALWLIFAVNPVFWGNVRDSFGDHTGGMIAFSLGIAFLFIVVMISVSVKYVTKPVYIFLILAAGASTWFMQRFGAVIDTDMIRNAAETTTSEAGHLMTPAFLFHLLVFAILPAAAVAFVRIRHLPFPKKLRQNLTVIIPLLVATGALAVWQNSAIAAAVRNHRIMIKTLNPVTPVASAVKFAIRSNQEKNIIAAPLDPDATLGQQVAEAGKPVVLVFVAGETARASDFSLGGYERETTPELAKRGVSYFSNVTSCGTSTAISIPCMFSVLTQSDYSHEGALATENVLDIMQHAGLRVEWWENNAGDKQVATRVPLRNFSAENDPAFCVAMECHDTVMLEPFEQWLRSLTGNAVLVIHQMGSHGPAYFARYTDEDRKFTPDCRTAELADCTADEIRNAYDNTIVATDRFIASLIDRLKAHEDRISPALIYVSDHGESLGEAGLYLHGAPWFIAPSEQTHVPMLFWSAASYDTATGLDRSCLDGTLATELSHDNIFHTILGTMEVQARHYDPALDFTSACRKNRSGS